MKFKQLFNLILPLYERIPRAVFSRWHSVRAAGSTGSNKCRKNILINWHGPVIPLSISFHFPSSFTSDQSDPLTIFNPLNCQSSTAEQQILSQAFLF